MDNIKLNKLYEEPKGKYNIISTVVFRLKDNYKSSMIYYNGLKRFVEKLPQNMPGYYLRIYYDDSIIKPEHNNNLIDNEIKEYWIPLFDKIKNEKHVQLIHYDHPDFKIKETIYHDGLFGTLVRFIPLFDYEDNINLNIVIVSDIDTPDVILNKGPRQLKFMKENKTLIHYNASSCYTSITRYDLLSDADIKRFPYVIKAGNIIIKDIKFPKELLDDFLIIMKNLNQKDANLINKFIQDERLAVYKSEIIKFIEHEKKSTYKQLITNQYTNFIYGIDEYVLAKYISSYIIENKIPYSCTVSNSLERSLYTWYLRTDKFKENDKYIEIMKQILGKYYDTSKSVAQNFEFMDNSIYKIREKEKKKYFYDNIFTVFKKLKNYEKYDLRWRDVNCINLYPYDEERDIKF